jgi:hypothetical protein
MKDKLHKAKEGTILYNKMRDDFIQQNEGHFSYRKNEERLHNKSNEGPIFA